MLQENERLGILLDDVKRSTLEYKNQLSSARREVTDVSGKFEHAKTKLDGSETEVKRLSGEMAKLESQATALREDKTSKERELAKIIQKVSIMLSCSVVKRDLDESFLNSHVLIKREQELHES